MAGSTIDSRSERTCHDNDGTKICNLVSLRDSFDHRMPLAGTFSKFVACMESLGGIPDAGGGWHSRARPWEGPPLDRKLRVRWIRCLCLLLLIFGLGQPTWAEDKPISLEDWSAPGVIASMKISPDGKWVAGIGSTRTTAVFLTEIDTSRTTIVAQRESDSRYLFGSWPLAVNWIGKDLLAVDYSTRESYAIDLNGKRIAKLGERFIRRLVEKGESSDWVLAYRDIDDGDIDAVNARTGERRKYRISLPGKLIHWAFDPSGALRAVTMMDTAFWAEKTKISNWYRTDEQAPWQLLEEGPVTGDH